MSYLFFSGVAVLLIERMGRRGLMMLSTFGQFLCFLIITILLRFSEVSTQGKSYASASIAFFFLYYAAFGIGMLGVPWLYPTEINSLPMRTKGAAVATATHWCVILLNILSRAVSNFLYVQDYKFCHCGNYTHWNSEYWLEILDHLDSDQCGLPVNTLFHLPRNWYVANQ